MCRSYTGRTPKPCYSLSYPYDRLHYHRKHLASLPCGAEIRRATFGNAPEALLGVRGAAAARLSADAFLGGRAMSQVEIERLDRALQQARADLVEAEGLLVADPTDEIAQMSVELFRSEVESFQQILKSGLHQG